MSPYIDRQRKPEPPRCSRLPGAPALCRKPGMLSRMFHLAGSGWQCPDCDRVYRLRWVSSGGYSVKRWELGAYQRPVSNQ